MNFKIGTIVSLKSNGLCYLANHSFLNLGGNEKFTTPLMVVVEILFNNNQEIDEDSGEIKSTSKNQNKYKCMYFSDKNMKFEENWFIESELSEYKLFKLDSNIKIEQSQDNSDQNESAETNLKSTLHKLRIGDVVRFKTVDEESKKSKSYNETENKKGIKPLITFIAPAMQVVGFASPEKKDQTIDPNTGKPKRRYPSKIVKCKFFNTDADKFSEQLVPIECLQYIDNSELENRLEEISIFIKNKNLIIIETKENKYFGKPTSVHIYSGRYQLSFYNELNKKQEYVWIDEIKEFYPMNINDGNYYPGLNNDSAELIGIFDFIQSNKGNIEGKHFKITYCNLKEQRISRYISIEKLGNELEEIGSIFEKKYYYLKSYCHLREAKRDFRSDRILSIRTIDDQRLNEFLSEKSNQ